jgi:hypothetical protein
MKGFNMQKKITPNMVRNWIGSDNLDTDSLLDLLTELINGEYSISDFQSDVLDYKRNEL